MHPPTHHNLHLPFFPQSARRAHSTHLVRRPLSLVMVILFLVPVLLSSADTFRMPLASMSKHTLIWGTPRGAGGMPAHVHPVRV